MSLSCLSIAVGGGPPSSATPAYRVYIAASVVADYGQRCRQHLTVASVKHSAWKPTTYLLKFLLREIRNKNLIVSLNKHSDRYVASRYRSTMACDMVALDSCRCCCEPAVRLRVASFEQNANFLVGQPTFSCGTGFKETYSWFDCRRTHRGDMEL